MDLAGWLFDAVFGTAYGLVIFGVSLLAAIPYGIWQGLKRAWRWRPGGTDGNTRTGG